MLGCLASSLQSLRRQRHCRNQLFDTAHQGKLSPCESLRTCLFVTSRGRTASVFVVCRLCGRVRRFLIRLCGCRSPLLCVLGSHGSVGDAGVFGLGLEPAAVEVADGASCSSDPLRQQLMPSEFATSCLMYCFRPLGSTYVPSRSDLQMYTCDAFA